MVKMINDFDTVRIIDRSLSKKQVLERMNDNPNYSCEYWKVIKISKNRFMVIEI